MQLLKPHKVISRIFALIEFNEFYLSTVKETKDITDEPILPRQRRLPQRYDDGSINYNYTSPQEYYLCLYCEVLDLLVNELSR